jgi:autotransporter-associated beta strand protein
MNPNLHWASFDNFSLTGTNVLGSASVTISPQTNAAIGGQPATFIAFIIGSAACQWQLNGTNLVGATNATLTIPSVTAADLGNYTVIANSVTSAPALLTLAATVSWNGGGTNANWTTAANWTGNPPANGDVLVFQGALRQNNTNDLLSSAGRIVFSNGGFTLQGNPLALQGGLVNVSGNSTHTLATTLTAPQSFVSSNGTLTVSGGVANGGFNLILDGAGSNRVTSWPITGSGALIKEGAGSASLSPAHYFNGGTIVNAGALYLVYNNSVSGAGTLQGALKFQKA